MTKETYAAAQKRLFKELPLLGWKVKENLVVPHATSPSGRVRVWFKKQAVHKNVSREPGKEPVYPGSLSLFIDIRGMSAQSFTEYCGVHIPSQKNG